MKTLLIDLDLQRFLTLSAFLLCVMLIDCCLLLFRVQETTLWWSHPLLVFLSGLYSKPSQQYLRSPNFSLIVLIDTTHTFSSLKGTAWFSAVSLWRPSCKICYTRLNTIFIFFSQRGLCLPLCAFFTLDPFGWVFWTAIPLFKNGFPLEMPNFFTF